MLFSFMVLSILSNCIAYTVMLAIFPDLCIKFWLFWQEMQFRELISYSGGFQLVHSYLFLYYFDHLISFQLGSKIKVDSTS